MPHLEYHIYQDTKGTYALNKWIVENGASDPLHIANTLADAIDWTIKDAKEEQLTAHIHINRP